MAADKTRTKNKTRSKHSVYTLVVGLGKTGLSVVRYLRALGETVIVVDSRDAPPALATLKKEYSDVKYFTGNFKKKLFVKAHRIIVSPGVALAEPALVKARNNNIEIIGDIDLFAHEVNAPVIAITGTNGKSTVTTLVTLMASQAGMKAVAGGNIGLPALDVLDENIDLYVLELSSFQLESLQCLPMKAAVVLNLSEDHLDRYENIFAYAITKQAIYKNAEVWVLNKDDLLANQVKVVADNQIRFTLNTPQENEFGICKDSMCKDGAGEENSQKVDQCADRTAIHGSLRHDAIMAVLPGHNYLCFGKQPLIAVNQLKIKGAHNLQNALAALALGKAAGLSLDSMINTLKEFKGLPHRTQYVAEINGVYWINDSKATNVGATIAALVGLPGKHVLIAGGDAKGADFTELAVIVKQHCRAVVLMGKDAVKIKAVLPETIPVVMVDDISMDGVYAENCQEQFQRMSMDGRYVAKSQDGGATMAAAIHAAQSLAKTGDNVLLSPACASFDMFDNFEHRGDVFIASVETLLSEVLS